jgi:hypothetical protein
MVLPDGSLAFKTKTTGPAMGQAAFNQTFPVRSESADRQALYPCTIDTSTPIRAASQSSPAAIACTKKPVSRFSTASA